MEGRQHINQLDGEWRGGPNKRDTSQDNWQCGEGTAALDDMANEVNGRLDKA